ncbi:MAG: hypothetical protein ACXADB_09225 [Candidatus Hermodarchaeia archaeon]|jgi:hypothetical protein
MKYSRALILIVIYFVIGLVPLFVIPSSSYPFTVVLPGSSAGIQVTILFCLYPLMILLFGVIFGYLLGPFYLILHKSLIGRKMAYGVSAPTSPVNEKFRFLGRGLFLGLVAISFALILTPFLSPLVLYVYVWGWGSGEPLFFTFIVSLVLTAGLAAVLFTGVWFLNDAGLSYSNQAKVLESGGLIEIRSVGGWFEQLLRGYAGISVIFSYLIIITGFWTSVQGISDPLSLALLAAIVFPIPIYMVLAVLPTLVILDLIKDHRTVFMLKVAKKLGITGEIEYQN